jgi:hypothetical protein
VTRQELLPKSQFSRISSSSSGRDTLEVTRKRPKDQPKSKEDSIAFEGPECPTKRRQHGSHMNEAHPVPPISSNRNLKISRRTWRMVRCPFQQRKRVEKHPASHSKQLTQRGAERRTEQVQYGDLKTLPHIRANLRRKGGETGSSLTSKCRRTFWG